MAEEFIQPNYLVHTDASDYKTKIENAIAIINQMAGNFAPHATTPNDMTVHVKPGRLSTSTGRGRPRPPPPWWRPPLTHGSIAWPSTRPRETW